MIKQIKGGVSDKITDEYQSAKALFLAVALWRSFGADTPHS